MDRRSKGLILFFIAFLIFAVGTIVYITLTAEEDSAPQAPGPILNPHEGWSDTQGKPLKLEGPLPDQASAWQTWRIDGLLEECRTGWMGPTLILECEQGQDPATIVRGTKDRD